MVLQIDAGHLGQAQQVDGYIRQFFPDVSTALAPCVEGFGDLPLEQAELQRDIGRVESLSDKVVRLWRCPSGRDRCLLSPGS